MDDDRTSNGHNRPDRRRPPELPATARLLLEAEGYDVVGEAEDGEAALAPGRPSCSPTSCCWTSASPTSTASTSPRRLTGDPAPPAVILISSRDASRLRPARRRQRRSGFIPKAELSGDALAGAAGDDAAAPRLLGSSAPPGSRSASSSRSSWPASDSADDKAHRRRPAPLIGCELRRHRPVRLVAAPGQPRRPADGRRSGFTWLLPALVAAGLAAAVRDRLRSSAAVPRRRVVHLLLAYPDGPRRATPRRALVVDRSATSTCGRRLALVSLLRRRTTPAPRALPDNLFAIFRRARRRRASSSTASAASGAVIILAPACVLVRRWRDATAPPAPGARRRCCWTGRWSACPGDLARLVDRSSDVSDDRRTASAARWPPLASLAVPFAYPGRPAAQPLRARRRGQRRCSTRSSIASRRACATRSPRRSATRRCDLVVLAPERALGRPEGRPVRRCPAIAASPRSSATASAIGAIIHDAGARATSPSWCDAVGRRGRAGAENERLRGRAARPRRRAAGVAREAHRVRPWPSAAASSATCTTARSSGSSRCRCRSALARAKLARRPDAAAELLDARRRGAAARRSRSCASWRAASTRRSSPTAASSRRCRRCRPRAGAGRARRARPSERLPGRRSRRRPTSSSPSR